jgi:hypothetical protein
MIIKSHKETFDKSMPLMYNVLLYYLKTKTQFKKKEQAPCQAMS